MSWRFRVWLVIAYKGIFVLIEGIFIQIMMCRLGRFWEDGRKSSSASFSYSSSVSLLGLTESFIGVLFRVGSWSLSRSLDDGGLRLCLAGAESVLDTGFDGLRGVRVTPPEFSSCPLGFFDLWERLVWMCENIVGHFLVQRIGATKL